MKCFKCSKGTMRAQETEIEATVKGEVLPVPCVAMVCGRCGYSVLSPEQVDDFSRASADAYRRRHGLLTTAEIRAFRAKLGMSQQAFAEYLRVGVASVKRWELGLIQDEAMDELMRMKCDGAHCRKVLAALEPGAATGKVELVLVRAAEGGQGPSLRRQSAVYFKGRRPRNGRLVRSLPS
jgi:putative zinc finger/helix-turn-helix YgiT family protein